MKRPSAYALLGSRRGSVAVNNFLTLIVIVAVITAVYLFVPPFYENWKLGNMFRSIAVKSTSMENSEQIKLYALEELRKQNFNFKPDELHVTKNGQVVQLRVTYPVTIALPVLGPLFQLRFDQQGGTQ